MAFNQVKLYRLLVLDIQLGANAVVTFYTELPDAGLNQVRQVTLAATSGRQPVKVKLPGTARGRYAKVAIAPTGTMRLFGMTLYGKVIGAAGETQWFWAPGPVEGTPEEWTSVKLPIPPTPEEFTAAPLPIPPTPEEWTEARLPIPPTPEEWSQMAVPLPATPDLPEWAALPVDA